MSVVGPNGTTEVVPFPKLDYIARLGKQPQSARSLDYVNRLRFASLFASLGMTMCAAQMTICEI